MVSPLLQGILTINQELGGSGGVEERVVNVTVLAISVRWMTNRNKCDRTEMRCSAHQGQVCVHPNSKLHFDNNTEQMAAQQKNLKGIVMHRAAVNTCA